MSIEHNLLSYRHVRVRVHTIPLGPLCCVRIYIEQLRADEVRVEERDVFGERLCIVHDRSLRRSCWSSFVCYRGVRGVAVVADVVVGVGVGISIDISIGIGAAFPSEAWTKLFKLCRYNIAQDVRDVARQTDRLEPADESVDEIVQRAYVVVSHAELGLVRMHDSAQRQGCERDGMVDMVCEVTGAVVCCIHGEIDDRGRQPYHLREDRAVDHRPR